MGRGAEPGTGVDPRPPLGATGGPPQALIKAGAGRKDPATAVPQEAAQREEMWIREVLSQSPDFGTLEMPAAFRML